MPVTHGVAGSSPVRTANKAQISHNRLVQTVRGVLLFEVPPKIPYFTPLVTPIRTPIAFFEKQVSLVYKCLIVRCLKLVF